MTVQESINTDEIEIKDSWATSVTEQIQRSRTLAWAVACVAALIAILEAIAIVFMLPLKTVEPYTLLVDRQTGHVEALAPLEAEVIAPDTALTRSFLVQYVIARESYDFDNLQSDYRKVALWTTGSERQRYINEMSASNPRSPLSIYPKQTRISVEILSVSSLSNDSSLVRFTTTRSDGGGRSGPPEHWAAVINYEFSGAEMSAEDRYINPLGFQVTRYRRDAETVLESDLVQSTDAQEPQMSGGAE